MEQKQKIVFIINPISGIGKQKTIEKLVPQLLDTTRFDFSFVYTQYQSHAKELADSAVKNNADLIAVVGGDGSVNEVSESLKNSGKIMAIIPTGSGNGIARHFKIPNHIHEAIKLLNNYSVIHCDTGLFDDRHFLGFAGIGFDAHIAHEFADLGIRGFKGYTRVVLRELRKYKAQQVKITNEKNESLVGKAFILSVANVSQYGNGVSIDPQANASDGLFRICLLEKMPYALFPFTLLKSFRGKIDQSRYFKSLAGSEFTVSLEKPTKIHIDGEPKTSINQSFTIKNQRETLKVAVKQLV